MAVGFPVGSAPTHTPPIAAKVGIAVTNAERNTNNNCKASALGGSVLQGNPIAVPAATGNPSYVQICTPNPDRKQMYLCNPGTTVLYIGLGFVPDATKYSFALLPCQTSANDGSGGIWIDEVWTGTIFATSNGGGSILATELV